MDEGAFGVDEEDVRDPDLLHQARVERPALVVAGRKRQPLVFPVVTQVESHGEVLRDADTKQRNLSFISQVLSAFKAWICIK